MNDLQKMIESCEEFEKNPVTNNFKWDVGRCTDYSTKTGIGVIKFWLLDNAEFWFRISDGNNVKLKSTTAQEAAKEALKLVKQEAQKLVDALEVEPKEQFYTAIDSENLPIDEVVGFNNVCCMEGFLQLRRDGVWCKNQYDAISSITHYATCEKLHSTFKIANQLHIEGKIKDFWTKIDLENLPKDEVFAVNQHNECLSGQVLKNSRGILRCESELNSILTPTHYCTYESIIKLLPKPN